MSQPAESNLHATPLNAWHRAHGARMVPFAGWDMPVEYTGVGEEHVAVRTRAGLFDVSHMGELEIAGPDALPAVQRMTSNDAARLEVGQAQYSALMTPQGAFVDDLLVYRFANDHFLMVVNASNADKDYAWIAGQVKDAGDVSAIDSSRRYALIAVQGPAARGVVQEIANQDLSTVRYYRFAHGEVAGVRATISRTGYTGEDGYELFVPPASATRVWDALLAAGRPAGLVPAGLAARDTLRLEAGMRLYGNDIDESTTVLEADLEWIVGWNKTEFIGRAALAEQKARGISKKLVGFEMLDRGVARHGYDVYMEGARVGAVTSGTVTPFLRKAVGMAYVPSSRTEPGTEFEVDIRGRRARARIVPLPFYKRPRG